MDKQFGQKNKKYLREIKKMIIRNCLKLKKIFSEKCKSRSQYLTAQSAKFCNLLLSRDYDNMNLKTNNNFFERNKYLINFIYNG